MGFFYSCNLERNGNRHRHKEHDSLVFTENAYYWNSRAEHGNAIDYLTRHMGFDFIGAVLELVKVAPIISKPSARDFALDAKTLNSNCYNAMAYLNKTRHISNNLIDCLIRDELLYQERRRNNIIFSMRDEHDKIVGAELHGVTEKRFKGIMRGSQYGYGFNIRFSDDNTFDYALFFESAIDLLSFMDYKLNHENKSLARCILVSMAGLKMNVIKHTIKIFHGVRVVLCVDNDSAGQAFGEKLKSENIPYIDRQPDSQYNDWNEQLKAIKPQGVPIKRLLKHGAEDKAANHSRERP